MAEYFDIVDRYGEPTGETVERELAHANGIRHRTSHLWLLRKKDGQVQVLLQKRSKNKDSFPGCYDISSAGHIPAGCEYKQSALRELKEELGIDANEDELVYCGDREIAIDKNFHGREFHDRQHSRVFIMWCDLEESDFTVQTEEVESVRWINLEECIVGVRESLFDNCISATELEMVRKGVKANGYGSI